MKKINLAVIGDIMPGGVLHYKDEFISNEVLSYLNQFDFRIGTLETAIGDDFAFDEEKMKGNKNIIFSKNDDISKVKKLGVNLVSLANNHIFDLGIEGFRNTVNLLKENNILYCGAGENIDEASKPVIIELNGKTIAVFSYCDYGNDYIGYVPIATKDNYGINPLDIEKVSSDIKQAKLKYDYTILILHWGREYTYFPTDYIRRLAFKIINLGADCIVGGHSHQIQPLIRYKKKSIFFSLGNFMFPDFYMTPPRPMWYPKQFINFNDIEQYYNYPREINVPSLNMWKDISRIGMIGTISIDKQLHSSYRLSYMTKDNYIVFKDGYKYRNIINIIGILTRFKHYKKIELFYYKYYKKGKYIILHPIKYLKIKINKNRNK